MASNQEILTTPPVHGPVYNILEICARENDAPSLAMDNYHFVFDVVTGIHGTERFEVAPAFDGALNNRAFEDVSRFLDQFIKEDIPEPTAAQIVNGFYQGEPEYILDYIIEVRSGWNVGGVFTVDPDGVGPVVTPTLYAWSASFSKHDWISQIKMPTPFNTWLCNAVNGTSAQFLTAFPNKTVQISDIGWTYLMTDTFADIARLKIVTFDDTGGLLATTNISNPVPGAVTLENILRVATAPASINMIPPAQIITGSQPIIDASVASYTVQIFNAGGAAPSSEEITFTVDTECRYETFRIHFLNKLGGFDAYNFTYRNQRKTDTVRKRYTKAETILSASDGIVYNHKDNGTTDYFVKSRDKAKLRSEYLSTEEHDWLKELIDSPTVYLEFVANPDTPSEYKDFIPVYVTTGKWEQKITSIDKLFRLDIDIEWAHENIRQRK